MASTFSTNTNLNKPATNDVSWDSPMRSNCDLLDALTPVGGLCVATKEVPSSTLNIKVGAGSFRASNHTFVTYAGTASQATTTAATNYVFLDDAGTLTLNTTGWPTTNHVKLAVVVAGASTITSVTDARVPFFSGGTWVRANANQAAITDSTGGTASFTLAAISDAPTANAVASLARQVAEFRTSLIAAGVIKGSS